MHEETSIRKKDRVLILKWFEQFSVGDQFTTDDVCRFVNRYLPKKIDPGTIRRELRYLRTENKINYKPVGQRREKIIMVLNLYSL